MKTMVKVLLPGCKPKNNDSSDALAIAITHANLRNSFNYKGRLFFSSNLEFLHCYLPFFFSIGHVLNHVKA